MFGKIDNILTLVLWFAGAISLFFSPTWTMVFWAYPAGAAGGQAISKLFLKDL